MITFQNDKEEQLWRETLLHWDGVVQEGFDMADKVVLAYRARCRTTLNINCTTGFDPTPFAAFERNFVPTAVATIRTTEQQDRIANPEGSNDGK